MSQGHQELQLLCSGVQALPGWGVRYTALMVPVQSGCVQSQGLCLCFHFFASSLLLSFQFPSDVTNLCFYQTLRFQKATVVSIFSQEHGCHPIIFPKRHFGGYFIPPFVSKLFCVNRKKADLMTWHSKCQPKWSGNNLNNPKYLYNQSGG